MGGKVQGAAVRYGLRDSLIAICAGLLTLAEWSSLVDTTIQDNTREDWKNDVKQGRKLSNYVQIKEAWKFEEYLEGNYSKGAILMARFRSGSIGIGEEMARWERRDEECDEGEDGVRMRCQKAATCRCCEEGVVEIVKHVLLECKAYEEARLEWRVQVEGIAKDAGGTFNALLTNYELQNAISDVTNSFNTGGLQGARG